MMVSLMGLEELCSINSKEKLSAITEYRKDNPGFNISPGTFIKYGAQSLSDADEKAMDKNWKAHISISQSQLSRAWDLLSPILHKKAVHFKIVNPNKLNEANIKVNESLSNFIQQKKSLQEDFLSNKSSLSELNSLADGIENPAEIFDGDKTKPEEVFNYIVKMYDDKIIINQEMLLEQQRMTDGMQITVYIPPGEEQEYQDLLQEIETTLIDNDISPGESYKTDRKIGEFCSIRHPGETYHAAVAVESYNPDNAQDNFNDLLALKIKSFKQELDSEISKLEKLEITPDLTGVEKENVNQVKILVSELKGLQQEFFSKDIKDQQVDFKSFQSEYFSAIKQADKKLHHKNYGSLIKNVALLFSGIGTLFAVASLVNKAVTGKYLFFDNKENVSSFAQRLQQRKDEGPAISSKLSDQVQFENNGDHINEIALDLDSDSDSDSDLGLGLGSDDSLKI